jgi:NADPH:quinone reductase-like Zn-dependent oxidoreductase
LRAIVQHRYGGAEVLEHREVPRPVVGAGQVLVRVGAAGVDRGAYHVMRGLPYLVRIAGYGLRRPKIEVPGTNFAGRVESVGAGVESFQVGDEVYGTCKGAFAELAVADADRIAPRPTALSVEEAAVLPYGGAVALQATRDHAELRPGRTVLVVGASGAVGTVAVQIAKALGAEVTGVCGAESADMVLGLGADHVVDYRTDDFASGEHRYHAVLDVGGNTSLRRLRRALSPLGTLVIVGGEGGGRVLGGVQRQLGAVLVSPFVHQRLRTFIASEKADVLRALNDLVDAGQLRPTVGRCVPLARAGDAVRDLEAGTTRGRLVVAP